jgi:hypothetical protein
LPNKNISTDLAIVRDGGTASDTFKNSLDIAQHVENGAMIDFG